MSSRNNQHDLDYDDDEIYDDDFSEEEENDDYDDYDDELIDCKEQEEEDVKQNVVVASLNIMTLSEKKKKQSSSSAISNKKKKKNAETNLIVHVEELEYHPTQPKTQEENNEKEELCQSVNFSLNILQSSKMYFENVEPTQLIQVSGNPNYVAQYKYLYNNTNALIKRKEYKSREEIMEKALNQPQLIIQSVSSNKVSQQVQQLFNRVDHLSCLSSSGNSLFIYGGRKGNNQFDDLIHYEFSTGKVYSYKALQYATDQSQTLKPIIPPLSNSAMFEYSQVLYILGKSKKGNFQAHVLSDVFNHQEIRISQQTVPMNEIPHRTSFSFTLLEGALEYYLFGGKSSQTMDDMYRLRWRTVNLIEVTPISKQNSIVWPSARYAHSACCVSNLIFIYGGINSSEQPLNDLYMFDTSTGVCTELVADSMIPPPLFKSQLFSVNNQSICLHGGQLDNQPTYSNSLFRFDIVDRKWNMIEILSDEQNRPFSGHQCNVVLGRVLMVGGVPDKQKDGNSKKSKTTGVVGSKEPSPIVKLFNTNDPGKSIQICSYLDSRRQEGYLCDVVFKVRDETAGSTFTHLLAHKCIIKSRCDHLHQKIENSTESMSSHLLCGIFNESEVTVVEISETCTEIFEQYLNYLYTGSIHSERVEELVNFVFQISPHKHFPLIQNICSKTSMKSLELNKQVLTMIHQDFSTLMVDHTYCDLNIVLDQQFTPIDDSTTIENFVETNELPVHRLIMSRSPFFSRMLVTSGMSESREKTVHLTDYSKEVMLDLLKYLYTDIIQLTPMNCIGIMVYSMMFDLIDLASCCRRMVVTLLDNQNVWSVHEIALLYNEKTLESECEKYIANNYSSLSFSGNFENLPESSRMSIKRMYEKKNKK